MRQQFALVLLDVRMPGMDGFETAANIKRLDQTKDVPIIFLTGAADDSGYASRRLPPLLTGSDPPDIPAPRRQIKEIRQLVNRGRVS